MIFLCKVNKSYLGFLAGDSVTLSRAAQNKLAKLGCSLHEAAMSISTLVRTVVDSSKSIHVELPLKRLVLGLIKVVSHDRDTEANRINHFEGLSTILPCHDVFEAQFLGIFKHRMKLRWERNCLVDVISCLGLRGHLKVNVRNAWDVHGRVGKKPVLLISRTWSFYLIDNHG
jgi:hypothetical protein